MSLLAFMKFIVEYPDQWSEYKRDPKTFLEQHPELALTDEEQQVVQGFRRPSMIEEATTVGRVTIMSSPEPASVTATAQGADKAAAPISLDGVQVYVFAHSEAHVFFAEPEYQPVMCTTLAHSSVLITDEQNRFFDIRLCYTNPTDPSDRPQVLYITTQPEGAVMPPGAISYEYKTVTLEIPPRQSQPSHPGYILALARESKFSQNPILLDEGSYYNPATGELVFNFHHVDNEVDNEDQ